MGVLRSRWGCGVRLSVGVACLLGFVGPSATASELAPQEPVASAIDDLQGLYLWKRGGQRGTIVAVITFAAHAPGDAPAYDPNVLYTLHIDNTADPYNRGTYADPLSDTNDNVSDIRVQVRFAQRDDGAWMYQVLDLPGADSRDLRSLVEGRVFLDGGQGTRATVGVFDNPEFFDLEGHERTVLNLADEANPEPDLAFSSLLTGAPTDGVAGTNVHAIVLEFRADAIVNPRTRSTYVHVWATAARRPPAEGGESSGTTDESGSSGATGSGSGSSS